jgi:sarcosine oxidase subunit gamma
MVEVRSALGGHLKTGRHGAAVTSPGVILREVTGRDLVQVGAWRDTIETVKGRLASELGLAEAPAIGRAREGNAITAFMIAPDRIWVAGPRDRGLDGRLSKILEPDEAVVTELGHSRTVLRLAGANARDVLSRFVAIDLDAARFPAGAFASVGVHGVGCLVHHVQDERDVPVFDLYIPSTFGLSLFEAIAEIAEQWGYELVA